ncbi:PREDICTED: scar-like domain-containing protein WAVE 5 [Tarenaya hassleriana]|uniref:scar-like domain-containing protein WAVE 5 n=1 Tax=Tarenaya hassleriana TaxID=28532 RepID=UPI00053C0C16|nr:PREDICTED: scar-like domain-containing protein WAVE 5 [Tarenaya hassleriana]
MPLVRLKVRNEFGLGRPELYGNGTVEDEDPKAVLGGVAVAGLVGILRQLGDLAEFAAEVFYGIQEQVTITASRSQKLTKRVRRIESALSPLEKAVLSQTSHIHFAYTAGCEWHPRIQNGQSHFIDSDLPLFVMESYEQCRDPPRLHLLDKFDAGGPGSCLRRYSDPTFFRKESSNPIVANDIKVQRDKGFRKSKKGRLSHRKIPKSRLASTSEETSGTCPSSLTDDRQTTSQSTSTNGMACTSNMQELSDEPGQPHLQGPSDAQEQPDERVQSDVQEPSKIHDSRNDSGYIEYFIHKSPTSEHEEQLSEGLLPMSPQHADSTCSDECKDAIEDNIQYNPSGEQPVPFAPSNAWEEKKTPDSLSEQKIEDEESTEILDSKFGPGTPDNDTKSQRGLARTDILFDDVYTVEQVPYRRQLSKVETIPQSESEGENQSERGSETESRSEADEYADARNTIESESDNDFDVQPTQKLEHCSEDVRKENNDESADSPFGHIAQDPEHDHSDDKSCSISYLQGNKEASHSLSVPVLEDTMSSEKNFQEPWDSVGAFCSSLAEADPAGEILQEEPVAANLLPEGMYSDESISPEESVPMYSSLAEAVPHKDISPGKLVAVYPLLAEVFPDESPKPVDMDQSLAKAIPQEEVSLGGPITTCLLSAEASVYERILSEESFTMSPSLTEAIPLKKMSSKEPVATYPLLTEAFPHESPDEPAATELPLAVVFPHENFSVEEPAPMYPSSAEAFLDERFSPEEPIVMHPYLTEAVPHKNTSSEESIALDSLSAEAFPDEVFLPEEPFVMDLSLAKAIPDEIISPEEHFNAYPSLSETVPDVKNSPEESDATYPSVAEAVSYGKILPEALDAACCSDGDHATDEPHTASDVSTNKKSLFASTEPESNETTPDKTIPQNPGYDLTTFNPRVSGDVHNKLKVESLTQLCSPPISGNELLDAKCPLPDATVKSCPDVRESLSSDVSVESVAIWSNGSLLGLEPSKPPVFAMPISENGDIQNENNGETSVISDGSVEINEKDSDLSSQHRSGVSYSMGSYQQSNVISFGVFGLSHRLLMNGFRRNLPACSYEAVPASSSTREAVEDVTEHGYQESNGSTFNEPFGSESLFDSPASSPRLEHMTISFNPIDSFGVPKLKLKIPSQAQCHEREAEMFPLFQLVPQTVSSPHNNASDLDDDDNDTFCRSSPGISVSGRTDHSLSDSDMWDSDGNPERQDGSLYDVLCGISPGDLASSFEQVGDKNTFAAGIGVEPSLSGYYLDIPCFDDVDTSRAIREAQNVSYTEIHENHTSQTEPASPKPPGSPKQDNVPEPDLCGSRRDQPLEHECSPKIPKSTSLAESPVESTADGKQFTATEQSDPRGNSSETPTKAKAIRKAVVTDEDD